MDDKWTIADEMNELADCEDLKEAERIRRKSHEERNIAIIEQAVAAVAGGILDLVTEEALNGHHHFLRTLEVDLGGSRYIADGMEGFFAELLKCRMRKDGFRAAIPSVYLEPYFSLLGLQYKIVFRIELGF